MRTMFLDQVWENWKFMPAAFLLIDVSSAS
jgi:hypothetical protein